MQALFQDPMPAVCHMQQAGLGPGNEAAKDGQLQVVTAMTGHPL